MTQDLQSRNTLDKEHRSTGNLKTWKPSQQNLSPIKLRAIISQMPDYWKLFNSTQAFLERLNQVNGKYEFNFFCTAKVYSL